ncbi:hypothetical protein BKH43_04585 [Helicobacter sp. 13S00401-1]|uniref:5-oxoprolinase subunit B/C family protein n=1 Tax=Helicobacter sp. 13S00401-1 TaxID=1905758 RepID=UPI000BA647F8|nr:5-oxoprolinase/urea amidolyase family protein [Helicobacter sp. 13S00401-1]PAF50373.1 hypothetical protein BKH43_04585 [Helicobacter sp. 13S00401-1]
MRFLPINLNSFLIELKDLNETLRLFDMLNELSSKEITLIIPAMKTLLISFNKDLTTKEELIKKIASLDLSKSFLKKQDSKKDLVTIPITYDGEDLEEVARLCKLSVKEVIKRHSSSEYRVAFCGFTPGFAYLSGGDKVLKVPRRKSPRISIKRGSIALADNFCGIYPTNSPGGWQIIGSTTLSMWDLSKNPSALLLPGLRVRFVDASTLDSALDSKTRCDETILSYDMMQIDKLDKAIEITKMLLPATIQDLGRKGQEKQGVSSAGALDRASFISANKILGNEENAPCIEIALGGFSFKSLADIKIAITGATLPITIKRDGVEIRAKSYKVLKIHSGDEVILGMASHGVRAYIGVFGGFKVKKILGSASSDTLANINPLLIKVKTKLFIDDNASKLTHTHIKKPSLLPKVGDIVVLDIVLGPRTNWFSYQTVSDFLTQEWLVTPKSNRIGIRLLADKLIKSKFEDELPSEGTLNGAIQIPHDGQPVLFLADHPITGGYPVIANVANYHLDLAAQIPIGAKIRFNVIADFDEIRVK